MLFVQRALALVARKLEILSPLFFKRGILEKDNHGRDSLHFSSTISWLGAKANVIHVHEFTISNLFHLKVIGISLLPSAFKTKPCGHSPPDCANVVLRSIHS